MKQTMVGEQRITGWQTVHIIVKRKEKKEATDWEITARFEVGEGEEPDSEWWEDVLKEVVAVLRDARRGSVENMALPLRDVAKAVR